jgi:hypothetical protein
VAELIHICDDRDVRLSANFKAGEFTKPEHKGPWFVADRLIVLLEKLRDHPLVRRSIRVTSGYRDWAHNQKAKGRPNSQHLYGRAADIQVDGVEPIMLAHAAYSVGFRAIGVADSFVHVDCRPTAPADGVFWSYTRSGELPPRQVEIIRTGR